MPSQPRLSKNLLSSANFSYGHSFEGPIPLPAPAEPARQTRPDETKARVLSEPSLLLQIARLGGKAGEDVSPSRGLKRVHSTAPPELCIRGKPVVVFRRAIRAM
jgi:hypothetical protein